MISEEKEIYYFFVENPGKHYGGSAIWPGLKCWIDNEHIGMEKGYSR